MASNLSKIKHELLEYLWLYNRYLKPKYLEEAKKLYTEYQALGGKSSFEKLQKSQY